VVVCSGADAWRLSVCCNYGPCRHAESTPDATLYTYLISSVGKASRRWTHGAAVARVEQPSTRVERAALLGKRTPEELAEAGYPMGDKAEKQRDVTCVLCSAVLVPDSYSFYIATKDCPRFRTVAPP